MRAGEATKALAHALYCLPEASNPEAEEVSAFGSTRPSSGESSGGIAGSEHLYWRFYSL